MSPAVQQHCCAALHRDPPAEHGAGVAAQLGGVPAPPAAAGKVPQLPDGAASGHTAPASQQVGDVKLFPRPHQHPGRHHHLAFRGDKEPADNSILCLLIGMRVVFSIKYFHKIQS